MQYGKKIITDNFSVKNYDFYHPNNIFVTNYVNLEGLVDFFYKAIPKSAFGIGRKI